MEWSTIKQLQAGDEVTWNDPAGPAGTQAEDFCPHGDPDCDCQILDLSRYNQVIAHIEIYDGGLPTVDDTIIFIKWLDGGELECFAHELS